MIIFSDGQWRHKTHAKLGHIYPSKWHEEIGCTYCTETVIVTNALLVFFRRTRPDDLR